MNPLMVATILVLAAGTCIQGYDESDYFRRYSKMKLLTACLGQETMARWRQQMISAGNECQDKSPLIPALLHQIPTVSQRQPFVPNAPFNVQPLQSQFRPNPSQVQQQQYQQQQQQHQIPYYQRIPHQQQQQQPFQQQQYYILSSSNNKIQRSQQPFRPFLYPQTSFYKPLVVPGQPWPIYQQGYSFTQSLPGNLVPTIQYITAPSQVELQKLNTQPIHSKHQGSSGGDQGAATPPVVRQEDTYTNPYIKVEDTEAYQQQQQQQFQQGAGMQRVPGGGPSQTSSFHQQYPFAPLEEGIDRRQKREAEARWEVYEGVSPARYPTSHQHQLQQQQSAEAVNDYRLRQMQTQVSEKLSNMTCVLRGMKMLTAELEPDLPFMETSLLELPISHELFEELKSGLQYCREASLCQPRRSQLHDLPITREFSASLEFFRCFGREKLRACLKADAAAMSQMLGAERGPLNWPVPGSSSGASFGDSLQELDDLLNGGGGNFVDLVLL